MPEALCPSAVAPHAETMAEEEDTVLADVRKLPLADRVAHTNWKVRGEAYDSIAAACERAFGDSEDLSEYGERQDAEAAETLPY